VYPIDQIVRSRRDRLTALPFSGVHRSKGRTARKCEEYNMLGMILIVVLILVLIGALPTWPHSRNWGYYPTGGLGFILLIVIILLLLGRI
jgi:uncharacterized membrane protein YkgB